MKHFYKIAAIAVIALIKYNTAAQIPEFKSISFEAKIT